MANLKITLTSEMDKSTNRQQGIAKSGAERLRLYICTKFNISNSIEL